MLTLDQALASAELRDDIFALAAMTSEDDLPAAVLWRVVQFFGYDRSAGIDQNTMYTYNVWVNKGMLADYNKVNKTWAHFLTELRLPGRTADAFDQFPDELPSVTGAWLQGAADGFKEGVGNVFSGGETLFKNLLWIVPVGIGLYLFAPSIRKIIIKG